MNEAREPAVFLDLWREKIFLGREFLTWLWIVSEIESLHCVCIYISS